MPRSTIDRVIRCVTAVSMLLSFLPPASVLAGQANYIPAPQEGEATVTPSPTLAATAVVTATVTVPLSPTVTAIVSPTAMVVVTATATLTPTILPAPTETPLPAPTETATPIVTVTPTVMATTPVTPTAMPTLTPTPVLTMTPTVTATLPVTPTLTPTPTPVPAPNLGLTMSVNPPRIRPGERVTMTITLSNASQLPVDDLTISSTLPAGLSYETPLGPISPSYNPLLHLLRWPVSADLSGASSLSVGYVGRVDAALGPGKLNVRAGLDSPHLSPITPTQSTSPLTIEAAGAALEPGQADRIQLGLKTANRGQGQAEVQRWVGVYVVDDQGVAVADGTVITLSLQGGQLDQTELQTKDGVAAARFKTPRGQAFTLSASAGSVQSSLSWPSGAPEAELLLGRKAQDERYGEAAAAIGRARNAMRAEGADEVAENRSRRVRFESDRMSYELKVQNSNLEEESEQLPPGERLQVGFQLTGLRAGQTSLMSGPQIRRVRDNWVTYGDETGLWQVAYEVGEASLEQYFVFEKGIPIAADLIIEGIFQTQLRPTYVSDEAGLRFAPAGPEGDEAVGVAYGPALVEDAQGRRFFAPLNLSGKKLKITLPAGWLAQAEFPIVVDPVIGPPELVSGLQGEADDPATASDGTDFLTVWEWNGDIYGQLVDTSGVLTGSLITVSQADGVQHGPTVAYNSQTQEYVVVWDDHRYGWSYNSLQAQRVSRTGQLLGSEIEVLPPSQGVGYQDIAVSDGGSYLVVWAHNTGSATGYDVYGQLLSSSGALSGTRLTIAQVSGTQSQSAVAYDSSEDLFMVVWQDYRSGTDYDLYSQQITTGGVLSGSNQVLVSSADSDTAPDIAGNRNGQFLVSWQRELSSSNYDVHGLRVAANTGQAIGSELAIDTDSGGKEYRAAVTGLSTGDYLVVWARLQLDSSGDGQQRRQFRNHANPERGDHGEPEEPRRGAGSRSSADDLDRYQSSRATNDHWPASGRQRDDER